MLRKSEPPTSDELMTDANPEKSGRVMTVVIKMKKLDLDEMKRAFAG